MVQDLKQGFFVKYEGQPYKGSVATANENAGLALVSFQHPVNKVWWDEEAIESSRLTLWTEGLKQLRVINPCKVLYESWRGQKCKACPFRSF
jgi:hypothetical protein